jgi:hypothetical protein
LISGRVSCGRHISFIKMSLCNVLKLRTFVNPRKIESDAFRYASLLGIGVNKTPISDQFRTAASAGSNVAAPASKTG